ncbi:cytochrome P450 1A1-like [Watersipora subatra]|uniref:cytochrome P450 1A1-like n=1 Tax=Watersipora subatra TaxID=2589382 RepID=UPI00355B5FBB
MLLSFLDVSSLLVVSLVAIVCCACWIRSRRSQDLPGPHWSLPLIGHLHLLTVQPHVALMNMQQKYGDIFKIQFGPYPAVVISGKRLIKDACQLSSLIGRPHKLFNSWSKHSRYFAFGHSAACLQYRKVTMKAIAFFTKEFCEEAVHEAIDELTNVLCNEGDGQCQRDLIRASVADISYLMCFGEKKKSRNDKNFQQVISSLTDILSFARIASLADLLPWALYLPAIRRKYKLYVAAQDRLAELVRLQEKRHKLLLELSPQSDACTSSDLCDLLINSMSSHELQELKMRNPGLGTLSEQTGMLLVAGYETVAVSLTWAIILLADHTDMQNKIREELTESKTSQLLEAFILESLRYSMASPLAMPHMTVSPATINGYKIAKDTLVLINLWSGSRDSRVWGEDVDRFNPYRFLDCSTGQIKAALADELLAFGSGRRRCVGEKLAKFEMRQFLIGIIQKCRILLADETKKVDYWTNTLHGRNTPPIVNLRFIKLQR